MAFSTLFIAEGCRFNTLTLLLLVTSALGTYDLCKYRDSASWCQPVGGSRSASVVTPDSSQSTPSRFTSPAHPVAPSSRCSRCWVDARAPLSYTPLATVPDKRADCRKACFTVSSGSLCRRALSSNSHR